jgi:hypothetical protein
MNPSPHLVAWLQLLGALVLEIGLVVAVAAGGQALLRRPSWRRTIWQASICSLAVLAVLELSGLTRQARGWAQAAWPRHGSPTLVKKVEPAPTGRIEPGLSLPPADPVVAPRRLPLPASPIAVARTVPFLSLNQVSATAGALGKSVSAPQRNEAVPEAASVSDWFILLLGGTWLGGCALVAARLGTGRLVFWLCRRQRPPVADARLLEKVQALAREVGLRRPVRVVESEAFSCPVAYGWWRPFIGLPLDFTHAYSAAGQEVMLLHELVHLSSRDPLWYALADLVAALFWWHPPVWWARRQLQAASEAAADEASLLVADGPAVLAECLLAVGARLIGSPDSVGIGIQGGAFRSGLGRRVARLVDLPGRTWLPPKRWRTRLAGTLLPASLAGVAIFSVAWTIPQPSNEETDMKTPFWKNSLVAMAVLAAADAGQPTASAADPDHAAGHPGHAAATANVPVAGNEAPASAHHSASAGMAALPRLESKEAQALRARLEAITLQTVMYDGLPLGEVVKNLSDEATRRSPDKGPINFLFSRARPAPLIGAAIDPNTGLPAAANEEVDLASVAIRIIPPLKNVRMIDALDAITRVADRPIKYSLEGYAVVFSAGSADAPLGLPPQPGLALAEPPVGRVGVAVRGSGMAPGHFQPMPQPLQTRAFKLPRQFFAGAEKTFQTKINTQSPEHVCAALAEVFTKAGVRKAPTLLYNEISDPTGNASLLVRATPEDMEVIQATVEFLGGSSSESRRARVDLLAVPAEPPARER